jgi:hypothetical protein
MHRRAATLYSPGRLHRATVKGVPNFNEPPRAIRLTPEIQSTLPEGMAESIAVGNFAVYAGSGISLDAFFPPWPALVKRLIDGATTLNIPMSHAHSATRLNEVGTSSSHLRYVAQNIRNLLRQGRQQWEEEYDGLIRTALFPAGHGRTALAHERLLQLGPSMIVTTNQDPCFQNATAAKDWKMMVIDPMADYTTAQLHSQTICYLHGYAQVASRLVLNTGDYYWAYVEHTGLRKFLRLFFENKDVLFVGSSFSEEEILSEFVLANRAGSRAWALAEDGSPEAYLFECLGVTVIPYRVESGSHKQVENTLSDWVHLILSQ